MNEQQRERTTNDLCTPPAVLDAVRRMGPIILDPCSNPWSTVGAAVAWDGANETVDGLLRWWSDAGEGIVFCNPPYGRGCMPRWADKVVAEARRGCEIVMLVKGDFSTDWWDALREEAAAIGYWRGRISFLGGAHGSGNFASALIYLGQRPHLFAHAFGDRADVRVLR